MKLETTNIINPIHPNRSTALFGGVSSGILNWNDIRYPSIYDKRERLRATFWSAGEINFSNDYITSEEKEVLAHKASQAQKRMEIAQNISDVSSDASVTSVLSTVIDQLSEQIITISTLVDDVETSSGDIRAIETVEQLYDEIKAFVELVSYDEQALGAGVSEFLARTKQDDSLHVDFLLTIAAIVVDETGIKTRTSEWLSDVKKTHELKLIEDVAVDESGVGSSSFHGFDDL